MNTSVASATDTDPDPIFGTRFNIPSPYPTVALISILCCVLVLFTGCCVLILMRTSAKVTVGTSTGRGSRGLAESTTWDRNYVRSVVAEAFEGQGLRRASDKASATQLEAILSACIGKSPTGDQVSGFEAACGNSEETSYGRVAVADALQACSATHLQGCSVRSNKDRLF